MPFSISALNCSFVREPYQQAPHKLEVSSQKEFLSEVQSVSETFLLHWTLEFQVEFAVLAIDIASSFFFIIFRLIANCKQFAIFFHNFIHWQTVCTIRLLPHWGNNLSNRYSCIVFGVNESKIFKFIHCHFYPLIMCYLNFVSSESLTQKSSLSKMQKRDGERLFQPIPPLSFYCYLSFAFSISIAGNSSALVTL